MFCIRLFVLSVYGVWVGSWCVTWFICGGGVLWLVWLLLLIVVGRICALVN